MHSSAESSTLISRITRWVAIPSALILLPNYLAFAAITTCPANFVSDEFSSTDHSNLASDASPPILKIDQLLNGLKSESYVIASSSLSTSGTLDAGGTNTYKAKTIGTNLQSFEFFQDFATKASTRTISYTFKNNFTKTDQALTNVSLSIYDIDANYVLTGNNTGTRYFEFSDQVTITGFTSSGASVTPTLKYSGAGITTTAPYRQTTSINSVLCATDSVDEKCKVSVAFDQPVVRVDVTYGNNPNLEYYDSSNSPSFFNPGDQLINIVFDGYCYLPQPRLTYTKALSTSRKTNTDQFTVQIKDNADNSVVTSGVTSTTTTGSSNTVTTGTGTTGTFKVNPTKTYTLTEALSGTASLADYTASYTCKQSDGTTITTLDPNKLKLTYGDNWTCTITNGRTNYVFSGIVFNDNGNVLSPSKDDTSSKYLNNSLYFNGKYDSPTESGIPFTAGHTITLNKCTGDSGTFSPQTVNIGVDGTYSFSLTPAQVGSYTKLCVTQNEPSNYTYSVDTTSNVLQIDITNSKYNYPNNNFGDVIQDNAPLVLKKAQYVHNCNASLNYTATAINQSTNDAKAGFSSEEARDVGADQCIAYRIIAYNRGHLELRDIRITDPLQSIKSKFSNPLPVGNPTNIYTSTTLPTTSTITTELFNLAAASSSSATQATLYFNTKYDTTASN